MMILFILVIVQIVIAAIVIFVLKHLLDRELQKAAFEKFASLRISEGSVIQVYSSKPLSQVAKEELISLAKHRSAGQKIEFQELGSLKGGLMIKVDQEVLDFSLSSRLENFWS